MTSKIKLWITQGPDRAGLYVALQEGGNTAFLVRETREFAHKESHVIQVHINMLHVADPERRCWDIAGNVVWFGKNNKLSGKAFTGSYQLVDGRIGHLEFKKI